MIDERSGMLLPCIPLLVVYSLISGVVDTKECNDMSNDMICFLSDLLSCLGKPHVCSCPSIIFF